MVFHIRFVIRNLDPEQFQENEEVTTHTKLNPYQPIV
jgi:hypothetical protein